MKIIGALQKAQIVIYGENDKKSDTVTCSINPSQYAVKNSVNYKEDMSFGADDSRLIFLSGGKSELNLTLYFDSESDQEENGSDGLATVDPSSLPPVTDKTEIIRNAMKIEGSLHKPPFVAFQWGNLDFKGVITSMTETFTMFNPFGKPIRAKMDLIIKAETDLSFSRKVSPLESPDRTKCRTVIEGMSLWAIAYEEYGDCEKWRVIAKANNLMSPLDIVPGQVIRIPAI